MIEFTYLTYSNSICKAENRNKRIFKLHVKQKLFSYKIDRQNSVDSQRVIDMKVTWIPHECYCDNL